MNNQNWIKKLPACFGVVDLAFAGHPSDAHRAKEMFKAAIDEDVSMDEIVLEAESLLKERCVAPEHVAKQLERIRNLGHAGSTDSE